MKIGDRVRFLNEIGGGRIAGFQGKNIVLVEDNDGFEIPMPVHEVILVDSDDYTSAKIVAKPAQTSEKAVSDSSMSVRQRMAEGLDEQDNTSDDDPSDGEITFRQPAEERKGGNNLYAYLAFVPTDIREFSSSDLECYLVNDSNYSMRYLILAAEGNSWQILFEGEIEPNTKEFLEELRRDRLNEWQRLAIQMTAFKRDKPFLLKPAVDIQLRVDPVKFYKLHSFTPNDFFEQPAFLLTIVENDEQSRQINIDVKALKQDMYAKDKSPQAKHSEKKEKEDVVVVDLHASELLDTTSGMSNADILQYQIKTFRDTMEQYRNTKGQKIVFIHGKGDGVLRNAVVHELQYRYKRCQYQDASFREYGYGATLVTVR